MSLKNKYEELNNLSKDCIEKIVNINQEYLKSDSMDYPYDEVDNMLNKYNLLYNKVIKQKNSFSFFFLIKKCKISLHYHHGMLLW